MSVASPTESASSNDLDTPDRPLGPFPTGVHSLAAAFLRKAREKWGKPAIIDSLGTKLTFGETLIRALLLSRLFKRKLGPEPYVGLIVPPGAAGAIANLAVTMLGKIAVNLNYSASKSVIDSSISQCGIRQVITTPKVLDKLGYQPAGEMLFLEDIAKAVTIFDKLWAAAMAKLAPLSLLEKIRPGFRPSLDKTATVIFTSGSTGDPKGVVLSQGNVLANVFQIDTHIDLLDEEVVLGILPFFHSFGYTIAIWTVLCLGKRAIYHYSPLDYRIIPDMIEKHGVTMIASSPTFMRNYLDRSKPGQLKTVVHMLLGSEKLKPMLTEAIKAQLGREPMEGYGCTETGPVVSVNTLQNMKTRDGRVVYGNKLGTTGMLLPGTAVKTIDPETGVDLPKGSEGIICVKGPQVMVGYLNKPEITAKVLKNGWYETGDLGYLDADGFLKITGRLSRFAKVAGEMVPLEGVETAIQEAAGVNETAVAVAAIPDVKRGERLVVLFTDLGTTPEALCQKLMATTIPKIWLPSPRDFLHVEEIPLIGPGKKNLTRLKEIALERTEKAD